MKQVININFQGRVVPIEVSAFDTLKEYTDSLRRYFANEEGRDEIINDIESRISELFQERLKGGATCVTDSDVEAIIKSIGRPEDFDEAAGGGGTDNAGNAGSSNQNTGSQQQSSSNTTGGSKRLYRDENNKAVGGVCAGLANYFGLDPVVVRVITVILVFAGGLGLLTYLVLWAAVPSSATKTIGGSRKKYFRDPDDKIIAGVCSGVGHYFGINPWIPRVLFLLPFISVVFNWGHWGFYDFPSFLRFSFSPGSTILYIILWLVVPEAANTTEKLEMKGEKVDMNSIKNSVMEEMKDVKHRAEKFGAELKSTVEEKSKTMGADINRVARRSSGSFGDIIALLAKGFAYFIIAIVCFGVVVALFGLGIGAIGIFPLKDYLLRDGWQNVLAWGTLLFFIAAPIIGIITWLIRRIAKVKNNSKVVRWSFLSLWFLGIICLINLLISLRNDFLYRSNKDGYEQTVFLSNPGVNSLELTSSSNQRYSRYKGLHFQPFEGFAPGDTAFVKNVSVLIEKAPTDSFKVLMARFANGGTRNQANENATRIQYQVTQNDSTLLVDNGVAVNQVDKFRNQHVVLTVFVPVGKKIRVNRNVGWGNEVWFDGPFVNGNWDIDWDEYARPHRNWDFNETYTMTEKGLQREDGSLVGEKRRSRSRTTVTYSSDDNNYRYDDDAPATGKIDSLKLIQQAESKKMLDSLQKALERTKREEEKLEQLKQKAEEKLDNAPEAAILNNSLPISSQLFQAAI